MRKSTLAEMRSLAQKRGGKCISRRYVSSRVALRWRCRRGHQWSAMPTNVTRGSWCPTCAHRKRLTLEEMRALAADRGGECLSDQYMNSETKLRWRCEAGHEWKAAPGPVKGGEWCPHCAHVARLSLHAMVEVASSRGGRCLSTEYVNADTRLLWACGAGHRWTATPASIKSGHWCSACAHNQRLELKALQQLARERGGKCLSTTYINNRYSLLWECKRRHRWKAAPANVKGGKGKRGTWCLKCYNLRRRFGTKDSVERMSQLARGRGGLCLSSEYINSKTKLLWQCEKGHCWSAVPVSVKQGSWCPVCARNQKLTLEGFRSVAARKGGRCLSDLYINKDRPLRWQCALGHRWSARPGKIKSGTWCAQCANLRRRSRWKRERRSRGSTARLKASLRYSCSYNPDGNQDCHASPKARAIQISDSRLYRVASGRRNRRNSPALRRLESWLALSADTKSDRQQHDRRGSRRPVTSDAQQHYLRRSYDAEA